MKTIKLIAVAFAALAAVSCVKDNMGGADSKTYQASFTDRLPDAKATIAVGQEESLVSWETSDRVGIMYGTSNLEYKADQAGSRSSLSAVSASADAAEVWAMLPYDASATLSSGVINTVLPSEQPAKAGASFHHLAVAHSTSANLAFSNVCGLVRVKVATEGITKVVFAGKSQEKVAGMISITVADCSVTGANAESVALVPAEGAASIAVGDYFLAVLPQTFESGFTVTAYKGETAVQTKDIAGSVTLERCGIIAGTGSNDTAYAETCASIGLVFFARRMLEIKAKLGLRDEVEEVVYISAEEAWETYKKEDDVKVLENNRTPIVKKMKQVIVDETEPVAESEQASDVQNGEDDGKVKFCDQCGAKIASSTAKFCAECGNKLM